MIQDNFKLNYPLVIDLNLTISFLLLSIKVIL